MSPQDALWWQDPTQIRPALDGDTEAHVVIIGAGFTGLWTAYWLLEHAPELRVVIVDREHVGFGASGRNGGWASGLFPTSPERIARTHGREAALQQLRTMLAAVGDLGKTIEREDIDCDWAHAGTVVLARSQVQMKRAVAEVAHARRWGLGENDLRLMDADEARSHANATDVVGATFTPHCAALNPGKLVRGLAHVVERRGAVIHERTRALLAEPHTVITSTGTIKADVVIRATEAWTPDLPGHERAVAPVYSLMIATEPLPEDLWNEIGLRDRETFSDHRHLVIYGQRTADGRLAFGGRGAPYHWGSRVHPDHDRHLPTHTALQNVLCDLFPQVRKHAITHRWGGPLAIPRDWFPSVGLNSSTGLGWAGGYVGDGVTASSVAGRTLADLVLNRDSDVARLPWVNHQSPLWEPEPLRWMGINSARLAMTLADTREKRTGRPSRMATTMQGLIGH
jgi:glycine/D-amino acid oxidase-like deaminating enzyme